LFCVGEYRENGERRKKGCWMMICMRIERSASNVVLFEGMRGKPQTIKGKKEYSAVVS